MHTIFKVNIRTYKLINLEEFANITDLFYDKNLP